MFKEGSIENYKMLNFLDYILEGCNGFVCGGCFKHIFTKESPKDIDVFFETKKDFEDAVASFDRKTPSYNCEDKDEDKFWFCYQNDNVKAYKHMKTGIRVELNRKIFGKPEEILKQFDFTITKFAYFTTCEHDDDNKLVVQKKVLFHEDFFEHLYMKRLVVDDMMLYPASTFERMFKYAKYGFFPCKETKAKIIQALHDMPLSEMKISESMYDGLD